MINPNISLQVQAPNVAPAIGIFENALANKQIRAQRQQSALLNPLQIQAKEQALKQGQINLDDENDRRDLTSISNFYELNKQIFDSADPVQLKDALIKRREQLIAQGKDTTQTDEALGMLEKGNIQGVINGFKNAHGLAGKSGLRDEGKQQFGSQETFKDEAGNYFLVTQKRNPNTGEVETIYTPVSGDPNLKPQGKLTPVSGSGQTAGEKSKGKIKEVREIEEIKTEEDEKRKKQGKEINTEAKVAEKKRKDATALDIYNVGIKNLESALGSTTTGTFVGLAPAFSSSAKVAEGAIAIMAPILKQIFKSAGEGSFTDDDQKLLMRMLPSRNDSQETIKMKLKFLDDVVRAKLGGGSNQQAPQAESTQAEAPSEYQTSSGGVKFKRIR